MLLSSMPPQWDDSIRKVFIKRILNIGRFALYVKNARVWDEDRKEDVIEYAKENFPNAEIIDKTADNKLKQ